MRVRRQQIPIPRVRIVPSAESLMFNTPRLWTDPVDFNGIENQDYVQHECTGGDTRMGSLLGWDFGNLYLSNERHTPSVPYLRI